MPTEPQIQFRFDLTGPERALNTFALDLETNGFSQVLGDIAQRAGRSIDLNFRTGGRPDKFEPLKPFTIALRRENAQLTGRQPVAGFTTPLRVTDTLRKAASAFKPGTEGSSVSLSPWHWENTLTLDYAATQNNGKGRIPARPFFFFQPADETMFTNLVLANVNARINRAMRQTG